MVQAVKLLPDRRVRQLSGHHADLGNHLETPKKKKIAPPLQLRSCALGFRSAAKGMPSARFARRGDTCKGVTSGYNGLLKPV